MSFDKDYPSRKDHRKPYRKSKAFDRSCRNHGDCPHCEGNRTHKNRRREPTEEKPKAKQERYMIDRRIKKVVAEALGCDEDEVKSEASLVADLGAESIDFLDIVFRLEDEFKAEGLKLDMEELIPDELRTNEYIRGFTVKQLVVIVQKKLEK